MPLKSTCLLFFILLSAVAVRAQDWDIGVTAGGAGYMGDLNARNITQISGLAGGFYARRNYSGYISAKVGYMHGQIVATDRLSSNPENQIRNLSFYDNLDELAATCEFNFLEFRPGIDRHAFSPYVFLGIGAVHYNPKAYYTDGRAYDLRPLTTEGQSKPYGSMAIAFPYGVGLKYNFNKKFTISTEAGYRNASTDYLDDVSGYYADPNKLTSDQSRYFADKRLSADRGTYGTQRGDLRPKDTYMFFTVSLSFTFVSDNCYFTTNGRYR